jgi:hypothetical protein
MVMHLDAVMRFMEVLPSEISLSAYFSCLASLRCGSTTALWDTEASRVFTETPVS